MTESAPVVTVDGPGGSGKGTVSWLLARRLDWRLLDSGALYRVLALAASGRGIALDDAPGLAALGRGLDVSFPAGARHGLVRVVLDGVDVSDAIRSEQCGSDASVLAALPAVREALLARQRSFRTPPGLVADGRDMGTVVFPDAPVKIFLTASAEERANRRYNQLKVKGIGVSLADLLAEIRERDRRDTEREVSPLRAADDAVVVDSTGRDIDDVFEYVWQVLQSRVPGAGA